MKNRAFTLIELLVVVLIIGILAAIAVPQYQLAVEKSRAAQVVSAISSIAQAQEVYYMATGHYTDQMADLDISVTAPKGWQYSLYNTTDYHKVEFGNTNLNYDVYLVHYYNNCGTTCIHPGQTYCWARSSSSIAKKICQSVGQTEGYQGDGEYRWLL